MANKIVGALEGIVIAWRDHIAWPSSVADIRELMRKGPQPVGSGGDSAAAGSGSTARSAGAGTAGNAKGGFDLNALIPTMTANRDLGHSGLSDMDDVDDIPGLTKRQIESLRAADFISLGDVRGASVERLSAIPGIGPKALEILKRA